MKTLRKLVLAAAAAAACAYSALAAPVATGRTYTIEDGKPYFDGESASGFLAAADNILAGKSPTRVGGTYTGTWHEAQASDFSCITDGEILDQGNNSNTYWENRILMDKDGTLTWEWEGNEPIKDIRIYTHWADGWRCDVSVKSIEIRVGTVWQALGNSSFSYSWMEDWNTVSPYDGEQSHNKRMVTFADSNPNVNLANAATGLRITFGNQCWTDETGLGYGAYWEIEAQRGTAEDSTVFTVVNTVNGSADYTGLGEVAVGVMPVVSGYSQYQFTVGNAEPVADGWKAYSAGDIPDDIIAFALPQELDAEITVHCRLKGTGVDDLDITDTIKSAYGAQPTASVSGSLSVVLPNTYDGVKVSAARLVALSTSTDNHGGIVSVTAEDAIVRGDTNLVLTVTNLAGNSATCNVAVTTTVAGGALPEGPFRTLLHLGEDFNTDDLSPNNGIGHDYLANFGGELNIRPYPGLTYTGLTTTDTTHTPGTLVWTAASISGEQWKPAPERDNYLKYYHIYVISPDDRDINWRYQSDDDTYVYVNGKLQFSTGYGTGTAAGHLRQGVNSIMIKFREGSGGDYMYLAPQSTSDEAFYDLTYRLDPGLFIVDSTTGIEELSSGQAQLKAIPRVGGYTKYQVFQDNEEGTVEPDANNWIAYDPDALSTASFGYTSPANFGDPVFFSVVLSNDDGTDTKRETVRIPTSNTFGSMTVEPFDVSVNVSGTTDVTSGNGVAVVSYGTRADALNASETFNIAEDGTFSGEIDGLKEGTEYFYAVEIRTGSVPTGYGSGKFRTLEFETYGNCAVVNGSASADGDSAVISFTSNGRIRFSNTVRADILLVGGGGGGGEGGYSGGGGGGAGGVIYQQSVFIAAGQYDVIVGKGGAENMKGTDTLFAGRHAFGGGAGNHGYSDANAECDGGSGGGASAVSDYGNRYSGTGTEGMGHNGGSCLRDTLLADYASGKIDSNVVKNGMGEFVNAGGGGGGAGAPGGGGTYTIGEYKTDGGVDTLFVNDYYAGVGGDGIACSITGEELWYGGGGGGGNGGWYRGGFIAAGGKGGGGKGGYVNDNNGGGAGEDGVDGTGGGGGGGGSKGNPSTHGGRGGDGIVIIRFVQTFADDSKAATGGNTVVKDKANGWMIHTFTEDGTFEIPNSTYVDVLLVGGGGGGGNGYGAAGGGGAGGMLVLEHVTLLAGKHPVTVGAGGRGGIRNREDGEDGGNTVFNGRTAYGGGGGAGIWNVNGRAGGSGGGAYSMTLMNTRGSYSGGSGVEGQGHDGGGSVLNGNNSDNFGAGGGGAGEAGSSATTDGPGKGGDGLMCDFSGQEKWYAGGGAGGGNGNVGWTIAAEGGKGGGGKSGHWPTGASTDYTSDGEAFVGHAENGTGGGGGGGAMWGNGNNQGPGGNGGSGIVIIRYKLRRTAFTVRIR